MSWPSLAAAVETGTALLLTLVAVRAWLATRSRKVLLLACAFALFLLEGILVSVALFVTTSPAVTDGLGTLGWSLTVQAAALVLLYVATLRPA